MKIQLIRHATVLLEVKGKKLLVDPMLSPAGALPPVNNSPNSRPNPLVELVGLPDLQQGIDAVLLTHTHFDHFDAEAAKQIPADKAVLCQPADEAKLKGLGFEQVLPVDGEVTWQGIRILQTGGEHGTGEIGKRMAPVSGYVLQTDGEPSLYICGDTIFCPPVATALAVHRPDIVMVNAGGARFLEGDPITMTAADVVQICREAPWARIVAVHLEAVNHCLGTRDELRMQLQREGLAGRVLIPADGESLTF